MYIFHLIIFYTEAVVAAPIAGKDVTIDSAAIMKFTVPTTSSNIHLFHLIIFYTEINTAMSISRTDIATIDNAAIL